MLIRGEEGVRWLPLSLVAVALVVTAYLVVTRFLFDDTATQVSVDEVLERYRQQQGEPPAAPPPPSTLAPATVPAVTTVPPGTTTPEQPAAAPTTVTPTTAPPTTQPAPDPELPAPGVYRYATTGHEYIDALGGTTHDYPVETTLTVTEEGCGVHLRWDFLAERYEEWNLCIVDGVIALQPTAVQFHEFYGQARTDAVECAETVAVNPPPEPGTVTARECVLGGEPWHPVWTYVGPSSTEVEGQTLETLDFETTIEIDDDEYWEHSIQRWTLAPTGLPVAVDIDMSSRNPSPLGGTVYTETIDATLISLTPLN